jgi:hypothetical protein
MYFSKCTIVLFVFYFLCSLSVYVYDILYHTHIQTSYTDCRLSWSKLAGLVYSIQAEPSATTSSSEILHTAPMMRGQSSKQGWDDKSVSAIAARL